MTWKRGATCRYRQVTKRWGVKLFFSQELRDKTYMLHQLTPELTPRVRLKFRHLGKHGDEYGYAIEHVEPIHAGMLSVTRLSSELQEVLSVVRDVRHGNVGVLRNRLVLFDLSECEL